MLLCEKPTFILTKMRITGNKPLWELQNFLTRYLAVYAVKLCLKADFRNLLEYKKTFINQKPTPRTSRYMIFAPVGSVGVEITKWRTHRKLRTAVYEITCYLLQYKQ